MTEQRGRWGDRLGPEELAGAAQRLLAAGALEGEHEAVLAHDLVLMRSRVQALIEAFPADTLHAIAVKANPVVAILRELIAAGAGLECASMEEVACCRLAGAEDASIVFDAPAKSRREIAAALSAGLIYNANDLAELDRIQAALEATAEPDKPRSIGIRVNPGVGAGTIAATSVSARRSKFGVPLAESEEALLDAFERHPWLNGLHVHVGSQGCELGLLIEAARRMDALAQRIEARCPGRLTQIDLGGGLPVAYTSEDQPPSLVAYVEGLKEAAPFLMSDRLRRVTEFGRGVHANAGFALSRVEAIRRDGPHPTALVHVGADLLLRPVYNPTDWRHEFLLLTPEGELKSGPTGPVDVAGPLCFGGDFIGRQVPLPEPEEGDLLVVRDTGAYTLSMWSRHCSRRQPPVYGLDGEAVSLLRPGETLESVARQWESPV